MSVRNRTESLENTHFICSHPKTMGTFDKNSKHEKAPSTWMAFFMFGKGAFTMFTESVFDYYYSDERSQFSFCRIPRQLITGGAFKGLSTDAKLLYALMLERMGLSARNGWHDELSRIYIYFTVNEIRQTLNCGNDKAIKLLAELDTVKGIGLIERVKQGQGKPTKIFVKNISKQIAQQENGPASALDDDQFNNQTQNCKESAVLTAEKSRPRVRKNRSQDIEKAECNYIDMNYTYLNYINPSIYQEPRPDQTPHSGWMDWIDKQGIKMSQKQIPYKQKMLEYGGNCAQLNNRPREGGQRRLWRRCNSKYGILTAKFHLLGAPPLIPPKVNKTMEWHTAIEPEKRALCAECSPFEDESVIRRPLPVKAARLLSQSCASRPVCGLAGP